MPPLHLGAPVCKMCLTGSDAGATTAHGCPVIIVCVDGCFEQDPVGSLAHELTHAKLDCLCPTNVLGATACEEGLCSEVEAYLQQGACLHDPGPRCLCQKACGSLPEGCPSVAGQCEARCLEMVRNGTCVDGCFRIPPPGGPVRGVPPLSLR